jgi:hypothetical protein
MTSFACKTSLDVGRWTLNVERCAHSKFPISIRKSALSSLSHRERVRVSAFPKTLCLPRPSAFTIIELMISIAMVVILMVGIHQIFKMTSDTVGMGNHLADDARSNRSVQAIFNDDYQRLLKNAPLFILRSGVAGDSASGKWGAFTSDSERSSDRDNDPLTQDFNNNGNEGEPGVVGELTPLCVYNSRNHRVDVVGFPANGLFRRATANDGSYTSPITSQDAFIFYEHLRLPTGVPSGGGGGTSTYYDPGDPTPLNVNNSLASQWILGRVALLMRDTPIFYNGAPAPDAFITRNFTGLPLSPLRWNSPSSDSTGRPLGDSRYDLLGASLETLRQDVSDIRTAIGPANSDGLVSTWWQPLVYMVPNPTTPTPPGNIVIGNHVTRFNANPRIAKPITSESMAKAMPVLLPNCSQFVVEFAGDFVTQWNQQIDPATGQADANWGNVTGPGPDGVIDFIVDHSKVTNTDYNVASRVRWYGLPRDTNGDGIITGFSPNPGYTRAKYDKTRTYGSVPGLPAYSNNNELVDVVPVDDVLRTTIGIYRQAAFEREIPFPAPNGDYAANLTGAPAKAAFRYTCVWVNSAPTMLRISLKLEDPAGRLPEGQWFEYVVGAP